MPVERSLYQLIEDLHFASACLAENPGHSRPRCRECKFLLHFGQAFETGAGYYEEGPTLCAWCKADRNEKDGRELRDSPPLGKPDSLESHSVESIPQGVGNE
jgi:hypothetical protein